MCSSLAWAIDRSTCPTMCRTSPTGRSKPPSSFRRLGDPQALAAVFDAVAAELLRVATHLTGRIDIAEDLVQGTFVTALEVRDTFDATPTVSSFTGGVLLVKKLVLPLVALVVLGTAAWWITPQVWRIHGTWQPIVELRLRRGASLHGTVRDEAAHGDGNELWRERWTPGREDHGEWTMSRTFPEGDWQIELRADTGQHASAEFNVSLESISRGGSVAPLSVRPPGFRDLRVEYDRGVAIDRYDVAR